MTEEFTDPNYPFPRETNQALRAAGFAQEHCFGSLRVCTINARKPGLG